MGHSADNAMLSTLGNFSKTNIPLMLRKEMEAAVGEIWQISARHNTRKFMIGACVEDIFKVANDAEIEGLLIRDFDYFTDDEQIKLCAKLRKSDAKVRGKFVFLVSNFDCLLPEVASSGICKITYCFSK